MWNPLNSNDKYYGEPLLYDPEFKGSKIERRTTDFKCFLFFVVCFMVWLAVAIFAFVQGDLSVFSSEINTKDLDQIGENSFVKTFLMDLNTAWPVIIASLVLGIVACLLFIAVMRWVAAYVTWISIILLLVFLGALSGYSVYAFATVKDTVQDTTPYIVSMVLTILLFVITAIMVFVFRRKIGMAIELIKEGARATNSSMHVMFFPIVHSLFEILVMTFAIYVLLKLSSIGEKNYSMSISSNATSCDCNGKTFMVTSKCFPEDFNRDCAGSECSRIAKCGLSFIDPPVHVKIFLAYSFFEMLWLGFFLTAFAEMVLAGVFGIWYWTYNKDNVPSDTFCQSLYRTIRFHLGTLAFGSLIITIIRIIRLMIQSVQSSLRDSNNLAAKCLLACIECIVRAIEDFMKMINKNAYILTAIHGSDFATSIKDAFNLIMRNVLSVIVLNNVTDLVFFIMKLLISLGATACFYTAVDGIYENIYNIWPLTIVYFLFMFFVTTMFFSVFSMAVDTIFLCFLEDMERNDGSADRPYFMSQNLREILQKQD